MATTRKPLIVNPDASQIQELPNGDSLDGITNLTATGTVQAEQLTSTDDATVTGEITVSGQPACLLTNPINYIADNTGDPSNHIGGTNEKPISFANETTNVNCTTSRASNATVNSGITSITVPSAGTYLVTASVSGINTSTNSNNTSTNKDQVRLCLGKTGITTFPNLNTFPASIFASDFGAEFNMNFALPLPLSANDALSIHFSHIGNSKGSIQEGHFSVTKLH